MKNYFANYLKEIYIHVFVDIVLMNISTSNIFRTLLLLKRYHKNSQTVWAATGMNRFSLTMLLGNFANT